MPNVDVNVGTNVTLDASQAKSQIKSLEAELKSLTSRLRFEGATSNFSEITSKVAKLEKTFEDLLKYIPDKEIAKTVTSFNNLSNTFNTLSSQPLSFQQVDTELQDIVTSTRAVRDAMNSSFGSQNISNIRANINELQNLNTRLQTLNSNINARGVNTTSDAQTRQLFSSIQSAQSNISTLANKSSDELVKRLKSGFKELESVAKKSFNTIYNISKTVVTKSASYLKSAFTSVLNSIGSKFKSIFSSSSSSGLAQHLKSLLLGAGVVKGLESAISLSSELTESQNRLQYVFGESADSVTEFAQTTAKAYGLTENAATKFASTFGGILSASGIASDELSDFSENLTKMTGDLASFYDVDQDVFFKKLQAGLAGNAAALRTYGINVSATNLELYRMSKGIQTAYTDMNQASKIILRYNYIVESASQAQGDFARTQFTWANQIRLLKAQFQSLAAIIGGYFVKTLLPVVRILNQIVQAAINAFTALASLFGFDSESIKNLTGGAKGTVFDESAAGYIDDTAEALGNESDALDKTGKAAKEAADNLQGFDKLNNITTSKASGASSGGSGASGVGAGLKPLDWSSLTEAPDIEKTPLEKWFDEFYNLLKDKKWKEAGKSLATQLNNITDTIYDKLTDQKVKKGIHNFNNALTDFYEGLLDYDTTKAGKTVGAGINLIAYSINDLYEQAVRKDLLSQTGAKIADFFDGLITETKWDDVGKAATTGFRVAMDTLAGFIEKAQETDLGTKIGNAIKDFLKGAVEILFGNDGAEEIGSNISGIMNLAFESFATAFGKDANDNSVVDDVADGILTVINTAIDGIDENDLADALTALLNVIGTLFSMLGDIDTDTLSDKIAYAVNTAVDNGSVTNAASGITSAILNLFNLIGKTIDKISWSDLGSAIIKGISDGLNTTEGESYLVKAFSILFGVKLLGSVGQFGISLLGNSIIKTLAGSFTGNAAVSTTIGSLASVFTVQNAAKFGLKGAVLAMAVSLGKTLVDGVKDGLDQTVATEDILDGMRDDLKGTITLSIDPSAYSNLQEYRDKLKELKGTYDNIATLVDDISFGEDNLTSIRDLTAYLDELEKAGAGGSTQFKNLKKAIDDYNNASILDKSAAFDNVYSLAQDLSLEFETTIDTIDSLNDIQFNALDANFSKLKQNTKFSEDEVTESTITWANAGEQLSKGLLDKVNETVDNDSTVDTSVKDLVTNATSDANTNATSSGKGVATNLTAGVTAALYADATVDNATSSLVADATSDSNTLAKSKGNGIASDITYGVKSNLDVDTTAKGAVSSLVERATSDENTKANSRGNSVGGGITFGIKSKLDEDTTAKGAMSSLVKNATSNENTGADSKGKSAGQSIIDGINAGIQDDTKQAGVFSGIHSFANSLVTKFKETLGIHSPSRLFKSISSFIPDGVALGVESNAKVATKAISNMCSSLSSEFENNDLDTSSLISVGKFDGMYDSLMRQTDMAFDYVASKFDNLRDMINLQSSLVVNPSVSRANLEAAYASASDVSGVVRSVGNIYSKLATSNLGSSNKPVQVNVYLDKNNKLSSYIINTVNGNITKTGNF